MNWSRLLERFRRLIEVMRRVPVAQAGPLTADDARRLLAGGTLGTPVGALIRDALVRFLPADPNHAHQPPPRHG